MSFRDSFRGLTRHGYDLPALTRLGVTTNYLVDTNNLTGYAQVVEEIQANTVVRAFTYGLDLISQRSSSGVNFYQYDGHGSVRGLTDSSANLTDTYAYDAFGTITEQTGTTQNNYLYAGEQFDADLGFYYNRARYLNAETGRFWSMDSYEAKVGDRANLHKYVYSVGNPINWCDPSGMMVTLEEQPIVTDFVGVMSNMSYQPLATVSQAGLAEFAVASEVAVVSSVEAGALGFTLSSSATAVSAFVLTAIAGSIAAESTTSEEDEEQSQIVYRVIREDENPSLGLFAKNPNATYKVEGHILNGSKPGFRSQYISTTKKLSVAQKWAARDGLRIVEIDL